MTSKRNLPPAPRGSHEYDLWAIGLNAEQRARAVEMQQARPYGPIAAALSYAISMREDLLGDILMMLATEEPSE